MIKKYHPLDVHFFMGGDFEKYTRLDCVPSLKEKYNDLQLYIFF